MRRSTSATLAVLTAGALALGVAGCTPEHPKPVAAGCARPGTASDSVAVAGRFGARPTVTLKTPMATAKATQRTVLTTGKGTVASLGSLVRVDYSMFNGTTGKELTSTGFEGRTLPVTLDRTRFLPGLVATLACTPVGSRVVGVIPPADGYGSTGSSALGIGPKDEIVVVADLVAVDPPPAPALTSPSGTAHPADPALPEVRVSKAGAPRISVPDVKQPSRYAEETLIEGDGPRVAHASNVVVNIQIVLWRTGKVVTGNDTWASGKTAVYNTGQYFPAFAKAVEGKTVGSRVLFVAPPSELYGPKGDADAGVRGTDDLVFLVDILGIA